MSWLILGGKLYLVFNSQTIKLTTGDAVFANYQLMT